MANFEFRSFWAKKVDFFCHGAPILPPSVPKNFQNSSNEPKCKWLNFILVMKYIQRWGHRGVKWALHDKKKSTFFAQKLRNSKFAINPFTNI